MRSLAAGVRLSGELPGRGRSFNVSHKPSGSLSVSCRAAAAPPAAAGILLSPCRVPRARGAVLSRPPAALFLLRRPGRERRKGPPSFVRRHGYTNRPGPERMLRARTRFASGGQEKARSIRSGPFPIGWRTLWVSLWKENIVNCPARRENFPLSNARKRSMLGRCAECGPEIPIPRLERLPRTLPPRSACPTGGRRTAAAGRAENEQRREAGERRSAARPPAGRDQSWMGSRP